jgi:[ribosomal protein S5]-alanine N-acetyltransferase
MQFTFSTQRLLLRPLQASDNDFVLALVNTPGWKKFIGDRKINNQQEAVAYIEKVNSNPNFHYSVVELLDTQQPIALVTFLHRIDRESPDIGFAILPQFERKGYVFEAVNAYLNWLISNCAIERIDAITMPNNYRSIKLLTKLNFERVKRILYQHESLELFSFKIHRHENANPSL